MAADAEEIAEDALRLIEVDYELLAFVVDLEAALRADAPKVREQVAEKLKLPEHRVRVIKQHMGGGFGSKQIAWKHAVIAALLSKQAGRPVQLMLDREAENLAAGHRNATRQRVRIGAKRDGALTALAARLEQNVGAYIVGGEGSNVSGIYQRLYRCPNVRTEQVLLYTNTGPAVAFRAPGHVEGAFALESAMDELARALGMDPLDLRLRNYADEDQVRGWPYTRPESLRRCYEHATEVFGWRRDQPPPTKDPKRRGIGLAAHDWGGGGFPPAYAWVKLNGDGTVDVITGTQDIGTGTRTGLTQVTAEELGLPLERVTVPSIVHAPVNLADPEANSTGAKGIGEPPLVPTAPAIANAVFDAIGVRFREVWRSARCRDAP